MDDWKLKPARDLELSARDRNRFVLRELGLLEATTRYAWWSFVRSYLTVYHRLRVYGREELPANPPFVIVANHESHLDSFCLGAAMPLRLGDRTFPLAAGDLFFDKPSVAAFSAFAVNALPVWRRKPSKQGLADLKTRLIEDACIYILFPEGTRRRGPEMGSFRPGFGMFVAGTDVPVVPARIDGAFRALRPGGRFPRPARISVRFGPAQQFSNVPNKRKGWNQIAESMETAVRKLADKNEGGNESGLAVVD